MNLETFSTLTIIIISGSTGLAIGAFCGFMIGTIGSAYCCYEITKESIDDADKRTEIAEKKYEELAKIIKQGE